MGVGTYTFSADLASSGDEQSPDDNTLTREFSISENVYSIDGLSYPVFFDPYDLDQDDDREYNPDNYGTSWEWIGTGWPGGDDTADGVRFANYFDIKETTNLTSIAIQLDVREHTTSLGTHQTTAGGEII